MSLARRDAAAGGMSTVSSAGPTRAIRVPPRSSTQQDSTDMSSDNSGSLQALRAQCHDALVDELRCACLGMGTRPVRGEDALRRGVLER
ncbi:hypothetical protein BC827DRAFT_1271867 [Russula dissimulans]|nr:hypothetical protein BC827DRAFT_1271867 [Russula dissimulans]